MALFSNLELDANTKQCEALKFGGFFQAQRKSFLQHSKWRRRWHTEVGGRKENLGNGDFNLLYLPQRAWTPGLKKVWGQSLLRFIPQHPVVKEQSSLCLAFSWGWELSWVSSHLLPWDPALNVFSGAAFYGHLLVDPSSASSLIAGGSVKVSHWDMLIVGSTSRRGSKR